jgi:hypothetical protein
MKIERTETIFVLFRFYAKIAKYETANIAIRSSDKIVNTENMYIAIMLSRYIAKCETGKIGLSEACMWRDQGKSGNVAIRETRKIASFGEV